MIEARSLRHVLDLADNPPAEYPLPPAFDQGSLTLYLARVPGSRDVFLTTVKPLEKVVRAADIESCLYYIHFETLKDASLLHEAQQSLLAEYPDAFTPLTGLYGQQGMLSRKSIPPTETPARINYSDGNPSQVENEHELQSKSTPAVKRKPVGKAIAKKTEPLGKESGNKSAPSNLKRLVGPRPMTGEMPGLGERNLNVMTEHGHAGSLPSSSLTRSTQLSRSPFAAKQQQLDDLYASNGNIDNHFASARSSTDPALAWRNITLIRRHGSEQRNVGKILANGAIHIFNDGHTKFERKIGMAGNSAETNTFSTRLERATHAPRNQAPQGLRTTNLRPTAWRQNDFKRHLDLPTHGRNNADQNGHHADDLMTSSKGTYFSTPWKHSCHFAASIGGRTLQCTLADPGATLAMTLSELRCNLPPSQGLRSAPRRLSGDSATGGKRRSFLHIHRRGRSEVSLNRCDLEPEGEADQERMDLSLGQESAGGGFGGKQAKLGKLIIHPEGFPMLDLLVASNIAMWSRVYEKCQRG